MSESVRCAIYTRVSTDQRLDREFNSLHAQHDAAEAFIRSQSHEGWKLLPEKYDDGGYSGRNLERPAVQRLLSDVEAGKIDVIVVYKIDRLTRSLMDFAKLVELFERHSVSFASVTQPLNTMTSIGRLTLNVLLSFAQFEREIAGERIRDKFRMAKRRGMPLAGSAPFGYDRINSKLIVNESEAQQVRIIFLKYLQFGTVKALARHLNKQGILTKSKNLKNGSTRGGGKFYVSSVRYILRNRFYIGEVVVEDGTVKGAHMPVLDRELFDAVQYRLDMQRWGLNMGTATAMGITHRKNQLLLGNPMK
jgi:site-specific DNA recombinase